MSIAPENQSNADIMFAKSNWYHNVPLRQVTVALEK